MTTLATALQQLEFAMFSSDNAAFSFLESAAQLVESMTVYDTEGILDERQKQILINRIVEPINQIIAFASAEQLDLQGVQKLVATLQDDSYQQAIAVELDLTTEQQDLLQQAAMGTITDFVTDGMVDVFSAFAEAFKPPAAKLWDGVSQPPSTSEVKQWLRENTPWAFLKNEPNPYDRKESFQAYADAKFELIDTPVIQYWNKYWEREVHERAPLSYERFVQMRDARNFSDLFFYYTLAMREYEESGSDAELCLASYAGNLIDETFSSVLYLLAGEYPVDTQNKRELIRFHLETVEEATQPRIMGGTASILNHLIERGTSLPEYTMAPEVTKDDPIIIEAATPFLDDEDVLTDKVMALLKSEGLASSKNGKKQALEFVRQQLKTTRNEKIVWTGENTLIQIELLSARYGVDMPKDENRVLWLATILEGVFAEAEKQKMFADLTNLTALIFSANQTETGLFQFFSKQIRQFAIAEANKLYQHHLDAI